MKLNHCFYFLLLIIAIKEISSICIPGDNCPTNSGICKADICECLPGYQTLINKNTNPVFCNYKQYSKWIPFFFELFLPSIGLFYIKRYFHGFIKLALFLPLIWGKNVPILIFLIFSLMYIVDLILLFLKVYNDGNGMPLV